MRDSKCSSSTKNTLTQSCSEYSATQKHFNVIKCHCQLKVSYLQCWGTGKNYSRYSTATSHSPHNMKNKTNHKCEWYALLCDAYSKPNATHTHTHTHLTALFPGLPRWAGTRKVKANWILLKQETVSGSGISSAICKSASRSRQILLRYPTAQCNWRHKNQRHKKVLLHNFVFLTVICYIQWSSCSVNFPFLSPFCRSIWVS